MDFWRIWRLINRRIYLVIGLALVAAVLVVIGIFIQNQRAGVVADARLTLQQAGPSVAMGNNGETTMVQTDTSKRISELATQLSGNNNIYTQAAELLRKDEESRKKEVYSILERNQYFAPYDAQIADKVSQLVSDGELPENQRDATIAAQRRKFRQDEVARLAAPRDRHGAYFPEGVKKEAGELADIYRQQVDVKPIISLMDTENSRQFDNQIQVMGNFQQESEALLYLNMLSVAFLDYYATNAQGATRVAIARLVKQKDAAELARQDAVRRMAAFKNQDEFTALLGQDVTGQSYQTLESRISELKGIRDSAEQAFNAAVANAASTPKTITVNLPADENLEYKRAKADVERLSVEVQRLSATKGESDPELLTARAALTTAQAQAKANHKNFTQSQPNPNYLTAQNALATARANFEGARAQLAAPEAQFQKLRVRLGRSPALQAEYSKLAREIEGLDKNLARINQELQSATMENIQSSRSGTIQITRAYVLPSKNTWANGIKLLVYATTLALLLGIALVIGLDALDNSVRTKKDAEDVLGLPVAGEIPAQLPDPRRAPRVTYLDPLSPTAEAYRLLRTDILFSQLEHPFKSLLIATVKPGQGATTTATNLAITMAQAGKKVILVDGDLRHPSLHQVFSLPNEKGLTTLLAGTSQAIDEALQRTEIESLLVLTSGPLPLNPSELVGSAQMRELHERLKAVADIVIVDAPSAIAFSDTSVLASFVDATMLVIRAGDVPRGAVEQVKGMLTKARANLIGVVLNAAPSESVDSVHYHNQYYPRLKAAGAMGGVPDEAAAAIDEEDRFEQLMSEGMDDDDYDDEDEEPEALAPAPMPSLKNPGVGTPPPAPAPVVSAPAAAPSAPVAQAAPIVVAAPVAPEPSTPVMSVVTAPAPVAAPVVESPRAVVVELPHAVATPARTTTPAPQPPPITFASAPMEPARTPERDEPLEPIKLPEAPRSVAEPRKTNWGTSPMSPPATPPEPVKEPVKDDNEITFEFDSDEDDEDYLEDFDDGYDEDYDDADEDFDEDDEESPRQKRKTAGLGGILGWFKRGR
ncbi:polysaccharide biosynthesis tyrosine autokinase [Armatimonas rosea]|uniref:Capsular exopolysaccharide synthesis family protein n=1 Tax=Armatimonas rosea TaxID=685828 RepID=A0A7W9SP80_ARMRO|nr:polysaccharide biosynthesis tyrosine autokinase [Armatimonas rosea]MBB6049513.1 capsular exopolysaccharide synthesis family protein [Armatimonas rosea]